jgi:HPt (histidine-containing phosphotransfer) domain-containing protein
MAAPGRVAAGETRSETSRDASTAIIDAAHLGRMTLGDRQLEREVLQLFVRQTAAMLARIVDTEPARAAVAAHTLVGSARGIGAWRVAEAAERVERAAGEGGGDRLGEAISVLTASSLEASAAIAAHLLENAREASGGDDTG